MHFLHRLCCCLLFEMRTRGEQDGREEANKAAAISARLGAFAQQSYGQLRPFEPDDERHVVLLCHGVPANVSRGRIKLSNLPDGRVDVLARCLGAALFVSHGLRKPVCVCRALVLRGGGVIFCYLSISFSAVSRPNFTSKYSFFSIFQDLQDPHTFAPLHIQNLQIFSNFSLKNDEFSRFLQIFGEICSNLHFFAEIFTDFYRNCGKC